MNASYRKMVCGLMATALLVSACNGDDDANGEGEVVVTAYGEEFVEEGIPADAMDDGWAIAFSKFEVTVRNVRVGGATAAGPFTLDLAEGSDGEGHEVARVTTATGEHTAPGFVLAGLEISGTATDGDVTKSFAWTFDDVVAYSGCEATITVAEDEPGTFEMTFHADHLFFDSLVSGEPGVVFAALAAADADDDGEITRAELEAADIGAYDPGNESIDNLWDWLRAQYLQMGHVDGEGHCESTPVQ